LIEAAYCGPGLGVSVMQARNRARHYQESRRLEKLALAVWVCLLVGASAGAGNHQRATVFEGFPTIPVPAGNTLAEARMNLGKGILHDSHTSGTNQPACSTCQQAR
jgi:cytochrome c peroxidase